MLALVLPCSRSPGLLCSLASSVTIFYGAPSSPLVRSTHGCLLCLLRAHLRAAPGCPVPVTDGPGLRWVQAVPGSQSALDFFHP